MRISYDIPTYLSDFKSSDDGRTIAKLKTFYVGETGDGRVFSKEFSEKLVKSLPNCPVVAYYSDLKDDFCGHNSTQYIYGIVPSDAEYSFEVEDGVEWMITEVLLYTDRGDNIGEIAQKIVGHPHSLEMDPDTTKYDIRMEKGKRKIYFTDGRLIGLSVLGSKEKPAFKGSEFFKENTEIREKFENFISFLENKDRGASMNKEQLEQLYSFISLSFDEKTKALRKAANEMVGDDAIVFMSQCFDDYCVFEVWDFGTGEDTFRRASYSIDENGQVTFGEFSTVYPRFVTAEEMENINNGDVTEQEPAFKDKDDDKDPKDDKDDKDPENKSEDENKDDDEDDFINSTVTENVNETNGVLNNTINDASTEGEENEPQTFQEDPKQVQDVQPSSSTTLSDSERAELEMLRQSQAELEMLRQNQVELEQFRLEKRLNLVASYKEEFAADTLASFNKMAETCTYEELEAKLALEFVKVSKNKKQNTVAFSFNGLDFGTPKTEVTYENLVKRYSKK